MTSFPASARARAAARPMTPAPTTTASTSSTAPPRPRDDSRCNRYHIAAMTTFLALLGVLGVLGMGVATMIRGGDPRRSNRLMQARVVMQGVALLVLALLMLLAGHR